MWDLGDQIRGLAVPPGSLAIMWLGQAGFLYKTAAGTTILIDPYLSDCVERLHGFKRIMRSPLAPGDLDVNSVVSTHAHADHCDVDALPVFGRDPRTTFLGSTGCLPLYQATGIDDRCTLLQPGSTTTIQDVMLMAVAADHGSRTPDALGIVLTASGICVWQVGDTAYRPDLWQDVFRMRPDVIIPPINGAYGNLDGTDAAKLARDAQARVAIPCHFWMFAEHNGDPGQFIKACRQHAPDVTPLLLTQGELILCSKGPHHEQLLVTSLH